VCVCKTILSNRRQPILLHIRIGFSNSALKILKGIQVNSIGQSRGIHSSLRLARDWALHSWT
jgi:hypothetical protein